MRLSDATSGAPYKTAAGYAFPYGDYFDIDVTPVGDERGDLERGRELHRTGRILVHGGA